MFSTDLIQYVRVERGGWVSVYSSAPSFRLHSSGPGASAQEVQPVTREHPVPISTQLIAEMKY